MDGLTAVRHIREEEAAGTLSLNLVIALSASNESISDCSDPDPTYIAGNARQGQIDEAKASGMDEGECGVSRTRVPKAHDTSVVVIKPYRLVCWCTPTPLTDVGRLAPKDR